MRGISRRRALAMAGVSLAGVVAGAVAQEPARPRRIGFITLRSARNEYDLAFRDALQRLGYVEGRTIEIDERWAAGSEERANAMARDLVARRVEVIVAATTPAIRASMRATQTVPIVMAAVADPVGSGLIAGFARPGGNVTGVSLVSTDTIAKRLELARELVPGATRVALLGMDTGQRSDRAAAGAAAPLQSAARSLGVALTTHWVGSGDALPGAFETMRRERAQVLIVSATPISIDHRSRIAELAAQHRLPAMYETEGFVEAGGLLSYGPSIADLYRRAAGYVDRIFRGAKPADLPVELPAKYDLVINRRTARELGVPLPPSLLRRADRVIE